MTFDPYAGKKLRNLIEECVSYVVPDRETALSAAREDGLEDVSTVLRCFIPDPVHRRALGSLLVDYVFRVVMESAKSLEDNGHPSSLNESIERHLRRTTSLPDEIIPRLRQRIKQALQTSRAPRPKNKIKRRKKEQQKDLACYLCGQGIADTEDVVLDHVWPVSAGGGGGENLRVAHEYCESIKHDQALPGDAPVGRFAFHRPPRALEPPNRPWWPSSIGTKAEFVAQLDDARAGTMATAVLTRFSFRCSACERPFSQSPKVHFLLQDNKLPWCYHNVLPVCAGCLPDSDLGK